MSCLLEWLKVMQVCVLQGLKLMQAKELVKVLAGLEDTYGPMYNLVCGLISTIPPSFPLLPSYFFSHGI